MKAYHFFGGTLRDGSPVPPDGQWLVHDGEIEMCARGFHASKCPFDALQYAPGNNLALVELGGEIIEGDDKAVAEKRKIIKRIDAEPILFQFAKDCALSVIHLWDAPEVVKDFLNGDESKRDAARAAAWDAARDAARDAAWDAAWAAAWAAARDAARQKQRELFRQAIEDAFND